MASIQIGNDFVHQATYKYIHVDMNTIVVFMFDEEMKSFSRSFWKILRSL